MRGLPLRDRREREALRQRYGRGVPNPEPVADLNPAPVAEHPVLFAAGNAPAVAVVDPTHIILQAGVGILAAYAFSYAWTYISGQQGGRRTRRNKKKLSKCHSRRR